ncbi:MAG: DnaD domain protein [Anaerolineae bacterium]|nr:DnaD domain protein [Anaerolineae bacterium]
MRHFSGFPDGKHTLVSLPEPFFSQLVPVIDDLDELKVTVIVLWRLSQMQSAAAPWVTMTEMHTDQVLENALLESKHGAFINALDRALDKAAARGTLLSCDWQLADGSIEKRFFANSPRGRAAVSAMRRGEAPKRYVLADRPNIFTLYEQNIGPLTAMISEDLADAETMFPEDWIEDAFHEAVQLNIRNWKYIFAILKRWQEEGRDEVGRRDRETDPKRYTEGKYGHLIQH